MKSKYSLPQKFLTARHSIWLVLVFHFTIWMAVALVLDPHPDMLDHWVWSRFLNFGYYEHPPMVALVMRFATLIGGSNELTLKVGSILFSVLILYLSFKVGTVFFSRRVALISVLLLESTSYFSIGSVFWNINQPYMVFWLLGLIIVGRFIKSNNYNWFLCLGIVLGLGAMSKYTMVLFPVGLLVWCLINREERKFIFKWQVYVGTLIALVIIAPNIYWNFQNEWLTFNFVLTKGLKGATFGRIFLDFFISQFFMYSLIYFPYFGYSLFSGKIKRSFYSFPANLNHQGLSFLLITGLLPLLFFSITSFTGDLTDPSWSNVSYFSIFILLANHISEQISKKHFRLQIRLFTVACFLNFLAAGIVVAQIHYKILPFSMSEGLSLNKLVDWQVTAEKIENALKKNNQQLPEYIISREYQLSSALSFYLNNQPIPHSLEKAERNQWSPAANIQEYEALAVCKPKECKNFIKKAKSRFQADFQFIDNIKVDHSGRTIRELQLYYLSPADIHPTD